MKYYSDDKKVVLLHVGRECCDTKTTANAISSLLKEKYHYIGSYTNPDILIFRKEK